MPDIATPIPLTPELSAVFPLASQACSSQLLLISSLENAVAFRMIGLNHHLQQLLLTLLIIESIRNGE
jgi:hypothetical protein